MTFMEVPLSSGTGDNNALQEERSFCYRMKINDQFDPLALSMLEKNDLQYFIRPTAQWMEEEVILRYPLSKDLESLAGGREWKKNDFLHFLRQLPAAGKEAGDYLLIQEEISWTDRLIFMGAQGPRIIYLPVSLAEGKVPLDHFLKKMIVEGSFSREGLDFLPGLIAAMGKKDFSLLDLEAFLTSTSSEKKDPIKPLFQDYPSPEELIKKKESKIEKVREKEEAGSMTRAGKNEKEPSFFQADDQKIGKKKKDKSSKKHDLSLYYLLTHFSMENWRVFRSQKKAEEKSPPEKRKKEGETQLLKGSGAFLWWDRKKRAIPLDKVPFDLGSGESTSLRLESPYVSRSHAQIRFEEGNYILVDLGSSNGTFLEGKRLDPGQQVPLKDQNQFSLAKEEFHFFSA
ncbi:FHA domain-containing protein [Kallipyga massiliensis]|uniref:FHA domain-containing protein n=1 Tax=Kallipyga massiliensis TaxID=1472764 RepID=UPI0004B63766|nr:FHA domain-containing protein [Kallipyga massiliensis]